MARGIKLTRYQMRQTPHWHVSGFRIRVEVTDTNGDIPSEIFLYRRHPPAPADGAIVDEFLSVASFPDLSEYPASDPDPEKGLSFFRLGYVELDVRSMSQYEEVWQNLLDAVTALVAALDRADDLVAAETVWVGEEAPASDSV